jgi:putative restriction endonuclease
MPLKIDPVLFDRFEEALRTSGWEYHALTPPREHPARYQLVHEHSQMIVRVYIWNTTPGGTNRPLDEWRIQPTNIGNQFQHEPNGATVILGWWDLGGVFTGYDYRFHTAPIGGSSSIQVRRHALDAAADNGMAVFNRGNGELAILFRPEFMGTYLSQMLALHEAGVAPAEVALIEQIVQAPEAVLDAQITATAASPRQYAMSVVRQAVRDAKFSRGVLAAYAYQCAFCGMQLGLLEAAHILPVAHPGSTDVVSNGIAACVLHHKAYDRGLITFRSNLQVEVNGPMVAWLEATGRSGGWEDFRNNLRSMIYIPYAAEHRPGDAFIREGNRVRGWPDA